MIKKAFGEASLQIVEPRKMIEGDAKLGINAVDLVRVLSAFSPLGIWRLEIQAGLIWCSKAAFEVFELDQSAAPANFLSLIEKIHEEDRQLFLGAIGDATQQCTGFSCRVRLGEAKRATKYIELAGLFRKNEHAGELYGSIKLTSCDEIYALVLAENPASDAHFLG